MSRKRNARGWSDPTETIWIFIDTSNSNARSKNYLWWFETREIARDFLRHRREVYPEAATLIGPFKYNRDPKYRHHGEVYFGELSRYATDFDKRRMPKWLNVKSQRATATTRAVSSGGKPPTRPSRRMAPASPTTTSNTLGATRTPTGTKATSRATKTASKKSRGRR